MRSTFFFELRLRKRINKVDNAETEFLFLMYTDGEKSQSVPLTNAFIFICTNLSSTTHRDVVFKGLKNSKREKGRGAYFR